MDTQNNTWSESFNKKFRVKFSEQQKK
uniref:Uncharacterized protein n=1 Tax=Anguilla anguilla TaxID=7936 RepID=A0A0E9SFL7_ANGAN